MIRKEIFDIGNWLCVAQCKCLYRNKELFADFCDHGVDWLIRFFVMN